jgi:ribosomal protein RSM22 (predicted rRNA methylase)
MNPALPPTLSAAIAALLEGVPRKDLALRAEKMSAAYRSGGTSHTIATPLDAAAYAVARMPATYAAIAAAFEMLARALPDFAPASLLDVGAGTGAASWAAITEWPDLAVTMLDHNAALRTLARKLADNGPLAQAEILAGDLGVEKPRADLVVAGYVLAELDEARAATVALGLWQSAAQALVLVEPGTPQGFARIKAARGALIAAGAHAAAPCTHDNACPLTEGDWCHFTQRLPRSRDHMLLKGANVPFEDERYAFVAVTRKAVSQQTARILAPPLESKPGLTFKLCDADGLRAQFVASRDKEEFRRIKKRGWGDLFD